MLLKKEDRIEQQISKESYVWEYPLQNKNLGVAMAKINGRFPQQGRTVNKVCDEIYVVISGEGIVYLENDIYHLKEGDTLLIKPGKKYYVEAKDLFLAISTSPDWYPEQQEIIY